MPDSGTPTQKLYQAIFNRLPEQDMDEADLPDLFEILDTLAPREAEVILKRFGITHKEMTQAAIAAEWEITPGRVGQIEQKALRKLKHPSRADKVKLLFALRSDLRKHINALNQCIDDLTAENNQLHVAQIVLQNSLHMIAQMASLHKDEIAQYGINQVVSADSHIDVLDFSMRVYSALIRSGIAMIGDLVSKNRKDLMRIRNLGSVGVKEIEKKLAGLGVVLHNN